MREEDKKPFTIAGVVFFFAAAAVIFFPYWGVLFGMVICSALAFAPLGIWKGLKDKSLPELRRVCFVLLGGGYIVGAAIICARILVKVEQFGWLGKFR